MQMTYPGDRHRIPLELSKMSHPLEYESAHLYNISNGKFAHTGAKINVHDSAYIGENMAV